MNRVRSLLVGVARRLLSPPNAAQTQASPSALFSNDTNRPAHDTKLAASLDRLGTWRQM
jgi:hypothetical protein